MYIVSHVNERNFKTVGPFLESLRKLKSCKSIIVTVGLSPEDYSFLINSYPTVDFRPLKTTSKVPYGEVNHGAFISVIPEAKNTDTILYVAPTCKIQRDFEHGELEYLGDRAASLRWLIGPYNYRPTIVPIGRKLQHSKLDQMFNSRAIYHKQTYLCNFIGARKLVWKQICSIYNNMINSVYEKSKKVETHNTLLNYILIMKNFKWRQADMYTYNCASCRNFIYKNYDGTVTIYNRPVLFAIPVPLEEPPPPPPPKVEPARDNVVYQPMTVTYETYDQVTQRRNSIIEVPVSHYTLSQAAIEELRRSLENVTMHGFHYGPTLLRPSFITASNW